MLLLTFFAIFSVKTARIDYKIEDDTKWFVVVYSGKNQCCNIQYSFPLNKVAHIESEELNFIDRKQISFRTEDVKLINKKQYYVQQYRYRFSFNDTISVNHTRSWNDTCDFVIFGVDPYKLRDTILTQSDWNNIQIKINNYLHSKTFVTQ